MKPSDCLPVDFAKYFHESWMLCSDRPVRVKVIGTSFQIQKQHKGKWSPMRPSQLAPFYPEGRCINAYNTGVAIGRRARQTARRSACYTHYEILFSSRGLSLDASIMWDLCTYNTYPTFDEASTKLLRGKSHSQAISKNLIICTTEEESYTILMWHARRVGIIDSGIFMPDIEQSCFTKLTRTELQEIGLQCL